MAEAKFDEFTKPVAIAYIGNKETKRDTISGTGVVWDGFGDVQSVDPRAAGRLLRFKKVFVKAEQLAEIKAKLKAQAKEDAEAKFAHAQAELARAQAAIDASAQMDDDDEGSEDSEILGKLVSAILSLDSNNPDHYTDGGKPKIDAVRATFGEDLPEFGSKELNAAYAQLSE